MDNKILAIDKRLGNEKGQGALETTLVFIMVVLLLGGITNIWLWSNNQLVDRQIEYNKKRVTAGTSSDTYTLVWPPDYTPPALTEDQVLLYR